MNNVIALAIDLNAILVPFAIIAGIALVLGIIFIMFIKKDSLKNGGLIAMGFGVPVGGNLEYADDATLLRALEGRREIG